MFFKFLLVGMAVIAVFIIGSGIVYVFQAAVTALTNIF